MSETLFTIPADNETVKAVVNQIRADLRGEARYSAYVTEFKVTRQTVKDHALALARLVTPETAQTVRNDDGTKTRTKFGNAVQAAGNGLRRALGKDDDDEKVTDWLRLVKQAAENAHEKGEISVDKIMAAVAETLNEALLAERDAA